MRGCPELNSIRISLATRRDAVRIARMSRVLIEVGLEWTWTPERVLRQIEDNETSVIVCRHYDRLVGFAVMRFLDEASHLLLLAVEPSYQRGSLGKRMLHWLERSAQTAGIFRVYLEVRAGNRRGQDFYRALGYETIAISHGYYGGRGAARRMARGIRGKSPS